MAQLNGTQELLTYRIDQHDEQIGQIKKSGEEMMLILTKQTTALENINTQMDRVADQAQKNTERVQALEQNAKVIEAEGKGGKEVYSYMLKYSLPFLILFFFIVTYIPPQKLLALLYHIKLVTQ